MKASPVAQWIQRYAAKISGSGRSPVAAPIAFLTGIDAPAGSVERKAVRKSGASHPHVGRLLPSEEPEYLREQVVPKLVP
jgi:hypothetical protein